MTFRFFEKKCFCPLRYLTIISLAPLLTNYWSYKTANEHKGVSVQFREGYEPWRLCREVLAVQVLIEAFQKSHFHYAVSS